MKTGIFVGSFNPFTIGHDSIVTRALPLFDRLVIGVVGDHVQKPGLPSAEERVAVIAKFYVSCCELLIPFFTISPVAVIAIDRASRRRL